MHPYITLTHIADYNIILTHAQHLRSHHHHIIAHSSTAGLLVTSVLSVLEVRLVIKHFLHEGELRCSFLLSASQRERSDHNIVCSNWL